MAAASSVPARLRRRCHNRAKAKVCSSSRNWLPKPGAAQPVGFEVNLEFLDVGFGIATAGVDRVINLPVGFKDVGHCKAGIEASGESLDPGNNPA